MKALFTSIVFLFAAKALAVGPTSATSLTPQTTSTLTNDLSDRDLSTGSRMSINDLDRTDGIRYNSTEAGLQMSSMNNGSLFMQVGILHEFQNGVAIGARGSLPMNYNDDVQIYMGQALLRFHLLNEENKMYLEPSLTQGYTSDASGTNTFAMLGLSYGYIRQLRQNFSVGGKVSADYGTSRISHDQIQSTRTIYSSLGLIGAYSF